MPREKLVENIEGFDVYQQRVCARCRVEVSNVCKLAELEKRLGRQVHLYDAVNNGVNVINIPSTCPNGYTKPNLGALLRPNEKH